MEGNIAAGRTKQGYCSIRTRLMISLTVREADGKYFMLKKKKCLTPVIFKPPYYLPYFSSA